MSMRFALMDARLKTWTFAEVDGRNPWSGLRSLGKVARSQTEVSMQIWVDADACPGAIKDILFRAAERERVQVTLVANQALRIPPSPYVRLVRVPAGFDVADKRIVELLAPEDLVITADIPLAAAAIDKNAHALNPRGELYTKDNIRERLSMRNFMDELRGSGITTGGPAALSQRDRQAFANSLDSFLAKRTR
jgi:uncharacterized protein YaiI (UPF0178 family)